MRRMLIGLAATALLAVPGSIASATAYADPPQCGDSAIVMPGCTSPGVCTAVVDGQCVAVQPPLLPPPPPVKVEIEGSVGT